MRHCHQRVGRGSPRTKEVDQTILPSKHSGTLAFPRQPTANQADRNKTDATHTRKTARGYVVLNVIAKPVPVVGMLVAVRWLAVNKVEYRAVG